jgi:hypothetical protein
MRAWACAAGLLLVFGLGCSGPTLDSGTWKLDSITFKVGPVPKEWHRLESGGSSVGFRDESHDATVVVNARCNIPSDDAPLLALTNHLMIGTTEREVTSQEIIPFDNREAMHSILRAKLDGVLLVWNAYVLKKDNCVYDFVYVAPPAHFDSGVGAFDRFVMGFHTQ